MEYQYYNPTFRRNPDPIQVTTKLVGNIWNMIKTVVSPIILVTCLSPRGKTDHCDDLILIEKNDMILLGVPNHWESELDLILTNLSRKRCDVDKIRLTIVIQRINVKVDFNPFRSFLEV